MTPSRTVVFAAVGLLGTVLWGPGITPARAQTPDDATNLAQQAQEFFKKYCAECHHGDKPTSGVKDYDVLDYSSLTKKRLKSGKEVYLVKGGVKGDEALKQSRLWRRAGVADQAGAEGDMPPDEAKHKPTDKEREAVLRKWLQAGAPPWPMESTMPVKPKE